MNQRDLIIRSLLDPGSVAKLSEADLDLLVRQGRRANLLAKLTDVLRRDEVWSKILEQARHQLESAWKMHEQQAVASRWEIKCIAEALESQDVPIVLLKGAAYLLADLPMSHGRSFGDVDILVHKHDIAKVESQLLIHGWQNLHLNEYDQRYYRKWMHEIPPLRHIRRGTHIDVHHTILPETARIRVNTPALFNHLVPLPGIAKHFHVLAPTDMLLHSATHLFHEGELGNGLRDLFDLDGLFRHFSAKPGFLDTLVPRAIELGLTRTLFYATRYTTRMLATPLPSTFIETTRIGAPEPHIVVLMDFCYERALRPMHTSCDVAGTATARFALYIRSHWIRMPVHLLVRHLWHKAFHSK